MGLERVGIGIKLQHLVDARLSTALGQLIDKAARLIGLDRGGQFQKHSFEFCGFFHLDLQGRDDTDHDCFSRL
jgi:hypothetical protein